MAIFATPRLRIMDLPADDRHVSPGRLQPRLIILHATAGTDSRAWLTTDPRSVVSIHRLIAKDGMIYKIADDHTICHHVGFSQIGRERGLNDISLGIEFENRNTGRDPYPLEQVDAGAAQIVEWWGVHGFLPILSHAQVDAPHTGGTKTDPAGFPWRVLYARIWHHLAQAAQGA